MELGFGVVRMAQLIAPFPDQLFGGEEAVHGAFRTQIPPFVEQRGDDFARRAVEEARGGEHVGDTLALGVVQRPGPGGGSGGAAGTRERAFGDGRRWLGPGPTPGTTPTCAASDVAAISSSSRR